MRFAAVLAISLLGVSSALGQAAPASPSQAVTSQTAAADAAPAHPITREQVHEIMVLTHANDLAHQLMRRMFVSMEKAFPPYMPQDVIEDLEHQMLQIDFEPMAVTAYQKHISADDAAQIIAFYKTSAGQRLLAVTPAITREMQINGAEEGERIVQQVIQAHMEEIKAASEKYKEDHTTEEPKITMPN